jgi:hypothetical protein
MCYVVLTHSTIVYDKLYGFFEFREFKKFLNFRIWN